MRPEGAGQLGGAQIAFRKNQKSHSMVVSSDEGELCVINWSGQQKVFNELEQKDQLIIVPKTDLLTSFWNNERSYRPTVGLEVSPFFEVRLHELLNIKPIGHYYDPARFSFLHLERRYSCSNFRQQHLTAGADHLRRVLALETRDCHHRTV